VDGAQTSGSMSVLMARQLPDDGPPRTGTAQQIQLPGFRDLLTRIGQEDHAPLDNKRSYSGSGASVDQFRPQLPSIGHHELPRSDRYQSRQPPPPPSPGLPLPVSGYRSQSHISHYHASPPLNGHVYPYTTSDSGARMAGHAPHSSFPEARSPTQATNPEVPNSKVLVGEQVVEGKLCYVYSDRTHCPKSINGDIVNPKWGTTKAGKPRKRLGQACQTCREKKIRCDPQVPKCAQCQKFGRECRFEQR
jgi:hypothetical protein